MQMYKIKNTRLISESRISIYTKYFIVPQEMKACLSSGQPYVNKAFMSSTTNIDRTAIFGDNLMLVIKSKKGVDVKAISHYASEDEIVFRAGSRFKVLNVYQEETRKYGFGKGWVVELEEI